jgi:hypothetical protein
MARQFPIMMRPSVRARFAPRAVMLVLRLFRGPPR